MHRLDRFEYETLAEFRYQILRFLRFSERAARAQGLNTQQHQLLLALKGLPAGTKPTIGALAERLQLRHHSTVELVDRLAGRGFVARASDQADHRLALVRITPRGSTTLRRLTQIHDEELHAAGPLLLDALRKVLR
jgi:DNA-binding MarR family transcriptional regulator